MEATHLWPPWLTGSYYPPQVGTVDFIEQQPFQSGLFKMAVIGLGNNDQATSPGRVCH
jgi:hypothetical protein